MVNQMANIPITKEIFGQILYLMRLKKFLFIYGIKPKDQFKINQEVNQRPFQN